MIKLKRIYNLIWWINLPIFFGEYLSQAKHLTLPWLQKQTWNLHGSSLGFCSWISTYLIEPKIHDLRNLIRKISKTIELNWRKTGQRKCSKYTYPNFTKNPSFFKGFSIGCLLHTFIKFPTTLIIQFKKISEENHNTQPPNWNMKLQILTCLSKKKKKKGTLGNIHFGLFWELIKRNSISPTPADLPFFLYLHGMHLYIRIRNKILKSDF